MKIDEVDFDKGGGLVPVVAQDAKSGEILMVAYANKEAVEKTLQTGYAHYYSRLRRRLWMKGEESGNKQKVIKILVDCDADSLIYLVEQIGVACHTGNRSCFYRELTK